LSAFDRISRTLNACLLASAQTVEHHPTCRFTICTASETFSKSFG